MAIRVKRLGKEAILLIDFGRELMRVTGVNYLTGGKTQYAVTLSIASSSARWKTLADDSLKHAAEGRASPAILEAGQAAGSLPPEVVLRVSARLAKAVPANPKERAEAEARGVDFNKKLEETWEFTARDVHRVVIEWPEKAGDEVVYRRAESLPFDSKNLCKDLLEGKIFLIEAGEGSGEPLHFAGTDYDIGDRTIEVFVNGKSALWVGESCPTAGYAESDARAFAALYEKLAAQARGAFQANATHGGRGR